MLSENYSFFNQFSQSLAHYGDRNWSPLDLAKLVVNSNHAVEPERQDLEWLRPKTTLLPPKLLAQLDEKRLVLERPDTDYPELLQTAIPQVILDGRFTDEDFLAVFPARTKLDLGIRRGRAKTVFRLFKAAKKVEVWARWIPQLVNLDYITVCMLLMYEFVHGDWLDFWARFKCLNSLDDLQKVTKWVSDRLKKEPCDMNLRLRYCEAGGVSGYRNPPFGNFDYFGESRALADAGEPHGLLCDNWDETFSRHAKLVQGDSVPNTVPFLTIEQFIKSDIASTSGASTFGKVEWEYEGEKGKFKARKNFLLDITTPEYLAEQTRLHLGKQVNKSFIKAELGKQRIAVTGDLWSYFSQSWLNYLAGGVYLKWPGNTMDERLFDQARRMQQMLDTAVNAYGLPFDFRAFDHQPETSEVVDLADKYLSRGVVNVPDAYKAEWSLFKTKTLQSFSNATIVAREGEKVEEVKIEGGVQSGIRLTSLLGNYWNSTMTSVGKEIVRKAGNMNEIPSWLRGDDSALYAKDYWTVLLMRLAYAAINAVGNDSKYGIHFEQSEFLRVWYAERCYGYVNRAIPNLLQRKPWSNEPWTPEGVLQAQLSTVDTMERRMSCKFDILRSVLIQEWTIIRKVSSDWLQAPTTIGGLGILPFKGKIPSKPWPQLNKPKVLFSTDPASLEYYKEKYKDYNITDLEASTIQQEMMLDKAATDDVRGMGKIFRDAYNKILLTVKDVEWSSVSLGTFPLADLPTTAALLRMTDQVISAEMLAKNRSAVFGHFKHLERWWNDTTLICQIRGTRPIKELEKYSPEAYREIRKLERRGLHRANAIDYIFGKISGIVATPLSPLLVEIVTASLANSMESWMQEGRRWTRTTWAWFTSTVGNWFAKELDSSPFSKRLFQW